MEEEFIKNLTPQSIKPKTWAEIKQLSQRKSITLSQSLKKKSCVSSTIKKRHSINSFDKKISARDDVLKKLFTTPLNNNHMFNTKKTVNDASLICDIENMSPASYLSQPLQIEMDCSPKESGNTNKIIHMTPKQNPCIQKINRDLNSPSARVRYRALKALKSPSKIESYCNYDVPTEEIDIITEEERKPETPKSIQEILKDVIVYVEIRSGKDNRSVGIKNVISLLGAKVNDKFLRTTTHVIFKDGLPSTYTKAKKWNIPVVSILWIEACKQFKRLMNPKYYPISNLEKYENPELFRKQKTFKELNVEEIIRKRNPPSIEQLNDNLNKPIDDEDDDIFQPKTPRPSNYIDKGEHRPQTPTNVTVLTLQKSIEKSKEIIASIEKNPGLCNVKNALNLDKVKRSFLFGSTEISDELDEGITMLSGSTDVSTNSNNQLSTKPFETTKIPKDFNFNKSRSSICFPIPMELSIKKNISKVNRRETIFSPYDMEESLKTPTTNLNTTNRRRTLYTPKPFFDYENKDEVYPDNNVGRETEKINVCSTKTNRRKTLGQRENTNDQVKAYINEEIYPKISTPIRRRTLFNPQNFNNSTSEMNKTESNKSTIKSINKNMTSQKPNYRRTLYQSPNILTSERKDIYSSTSISSSSTTPRQSRIDSYYKQNKPPVVTEPAPVPVVPTKRKLYDPSHGVDELELILSQAKINSNKKPRLNISNKSELIKSNSKTTETSSSSIRKSTRRSSMHFAKPTPSKIADTLSQSEKTFDSVLVTTNLHKNQFDIVKEAIRKLGKFKLEDTVTKATTHLVTFESRRTINMLRGLIRGVWMLNFKWIEDSLKKCKWLHEESYEINDFSRAVQICRFERQAFGNEYKMDLFMDIDRIFISRKSNVPYSHLKELIGLCSGKITTNMKNAKYIIGEKFITDENIKCLSPLWILDSIKDKKIKKIHKYLLKEEDFE